MNGSGTERNSAKRNLIIFFLLAFILAWAVWIPAGLFAPDTPILVIPGAWAPTVAALILVWWTKGMSGIKELLGKVVKWKVPIPYYLFAIMGMLTVTLLAILIQALLGGQIPDPAVVATNFGFPEDQVLLFFLLTPIIFISTIFAGGPIAEELGWRGYAQPKLQARIGAGPAGLFIGLIWSLWHLPLFYYYPSAVGGLPLEFYIPLVTAFGILFAWLYNRSEGSVLLCILLHAGINFSIGVLGADMLTGDTQLLIILTVLTGILALILFSTIRGTVTPGAEAEPSK